MDRAKVMAIGGALVMAGFLIGRMTGPAGEAHAQTTAGHDFSPFRSGGDVIFTQSADGMTLHAWAPRGHGETIWNRAMPVYKGSTEAPR